MITQCGTAIRSTVRYQLRRLLLDGVIDIETPTVFTIAEDFGYVNAIEFAVAVQSWTQEQLKRGI